MPITWCEIEQEAIDLSPGRFDNCPVHLTWVGVSCMSAMSALKKLQARTRGILGPPFYTATATTMEERLFPVVPSIFLEP